MIQVLLSILTHGAALIFYPGLLTLAVFGAVVEIVWMRLGRRDAMWPALPRRRPSPVVGTIALCASLAAVELAAPFNPVPGDERSIVVAAIALALTAWAQLVMTAEFVPESGLLLVVQFCWLLAVLGPAVQPESLRPQVLGYLVVPGLLPVKIACAFLYVLCMPALLRLWPFSPQADQRVRPRLDAARALTWFPYCSLFVTLFVPPSSDDLAGLFRFAGLTVAVAALVVGLAAFLRWRGAEIARGLYSRVITPFAGVVLAIVVATSILMR